MPKSETPEKLIHSAKAAFEKQNYSEAARLFQQVLDVIDPTRQTLDHAEARNNLSVALLKCGKAQEAFDSVSGTDLVFAKQGLKDQQAMALGNAGAALVDLKRFDEALETYRRSAELFKETGNNELRSFVMQEISTLQLKQGKQIESLFAMDAALQSRKKLTWRESLLKKLMKIVHRGLGTNQGS